MKNTLQLLYDKINTYPDFPKEGVQFKDFLPILMDKSARGLLITLISKTVPDNVTCIVSPESRGFLLGILVAEKLGLKFVPIRKKGKLPGNVHKVSYKTEYSKDSIEIQEDSVYGDRCWFIDDIFATGGTYDAAGKLMEKDSGVLIGGTVLLKVLTDGPKEVIELFKEVKS